MGWSGVIVLLRLRFLYYKTGFLVFFTLLVYNRYIRILSEVDFCFWF